MFKIIKKSKKSRARVGVLKTLHGAIKTPFFMPIATKGAVKSLTSFEVEKLKSQIILSNTYHMLLRPGLEILKKAGGLHKFMDWHKPILTDSGGFQVFSLSKIRKILPNGVKFCSHIDGKEFLLTPKKALEIQKIIGSDIRMVLDVCPAFPCTHKEAEDAVNTTTKWAKESLKHRNLCHAQLVSSSIPSDSRHPELVSGSNNSETLFDEKTLKQVQGDGFLLFPIVQGSVYKDLRLKSAKELVDMSKTSDWDGYAIGGVAVGEPFESALEILDYTVPALPENKPHYLMGLGYPEQIIEAVKKGIDMFDCVIPTREARHGRLYFFKDKKFKYSSSSIRNAKFAKDFSPINSDSKIKELRIYTKAYLHHLFKTQEPLCIRLATLNNVEFYLSLMLRIRESIKKGKL